MNSSFQARVDAANTAILDATKRRDEVRQRLDALLERARGVDRWDLQTARNGARKGIAADRETVDLVDDALPRARYELQQCELDVTRFTQALEELVAFAPGMRVSGRPEVEFYSPGNAPRGDQPVRAKRG